MIQKSHFNHHRQMYSNKFWIIAAAVVTVTAFWSTSITCVSGSPTKLDSNVATLPLEQRPAFVSQAIAAAYEAVDNAANRKQRTTNTSPSLSKSIDDSYGNPIDSLKPIDTPDGRKVVSAQGVQFEIPSYASGITDIKKPDDDLLPPFIVPIHQNARAPLSNGNFNYPNIPTDISIINRIAAKYHNPIPTLDPIAVAYPDDEGSTIGDTVATPIDGQAPLTIEKVSVDESNSRDQQQQQQESVNSPKVVAGLPAYLLELNDPDIGGPVDYIMKDDGLALKVIAWDLLPPFEDDPQNINDDRSQSKRIQGVLDTKPKTTRFSLSSVQSADPAIPEKNNNVDNVGGRNNIIDSRPSRTNNVQIQSRGNTYYSSTTTSTPTTLKITRPIITTTTTTTTTTKRPTTTRRTTSPSTTTTTSTTAEPTIGQSEDEPDYLELEAGDSYTLPPWLAGFDDPDLDVALAYVPPEGNDYDYNQTVSRDLLPPYEPFVDLKDVNVSTPKEMKTITTAKTTTTKRPTTTTTTTTATTRRMVTQQQSTSRPQWVRAGPTIAAVRTSFDRNNQNENIKTPAPLSSSSSSPITSIKSKLSTSSLDRIPSADEQPKKPAFGANNPFLSNRNNGQYNRQSNLLKTSTTPRTTTKTTTTTTSTTTTTPTPEYDENPFDSATVPSWLQGLDYADIGPGVPYSPDDSDTKKTTHPSVPPTSSSNNNNNSNKNSNSNKKKENFSNDLLPPTTIEAQATNAASPAFLAPSPASFGSFSHQTQHSSTTPFQSTASTTSSFPSRVSPTFPPSASHIPQTISNRNSGTAQLPMRFPPTRTSGIGQAATSGGDGDGDGDGDNNDNDSNNNKQFGSSSFNPNFPAPFGPPPSEEKSTDDNGLAGAPAPGQGFPPFSSPTSHMIPHKTTYTKSDDGKVLTTQPSSRPFHSVDDGNIGSLGTEYQVSNTQQTSNTASSSVFHSTAAVNRKQTTSSISFGQQPTGFTAPPNVYHTQSSGLGGGGDTSIGVNAQKPRNPFLPAPFIAKQSAPANASKSPAFDGSVHDQHAAASTSVNKYRGKFGGPPGVLQPYDNVSGGKS